MLDASYLGLKARPCRELANLAIVPDVREQLALFADEFEAHAEALDRVGMATREGDATC